MNTLKKVESFEKENGSFEFEGKKYILLQQAYLSDYKCEPCYHASAICTTDTVSKDECQPVYTVRWDIDENYNAEDMDEGNACDWDNPVDVTESGEYDFSSNRIY